MTQQQIPVYIKYGKEITNLNEIMATLARQIVMRDPDYRDLDGQLKVYLSLERELRGEQIQPPFEPEKIPVEPVEEKKTEPVKKE